MLLEYCVPMKDPKTAPVISTTSTSALVYLKEGYSLIPMVHNFPTNVVNLWVYMILRTNSPAQRDVHV